MLLFVEAVVNDPKLEAATVDARTGEGPTEREIRDLLSDPIGGLSGREARVLLRLLDEARAALAVAPTPGARWREEGKADPHGDRYARERATLAYGHLTDDQLANAVFLEPNIGYLTGAKDRIRWLSRQLEQASADDPQWDATDAAHPAWWRGNDAGVAVTVTKLTEALDGKDEGHGVIGYEPLERLRRRLTAINAGESIETAPIDDTLFIAGTEDGRRMIWRGSLLAHQRADYAKTPEHLRFPATRWWKLP